MVRGIRIISERLELHKYSPTSSPVLISAWTRTGCSTVGGGMMDASGDLGAIARGVPVLNMLHIEDIMHLL